MLNLLDYENHLWKSLQVVAGIDEVGRGCLAGPLVAGIVVWDPQYILKQNEELQKIIQDNQIDPESSRTLFNKNVKKALTATSKSSASQEPPVPDHDLNYLILINDSKKVNEPTRNKLAEFIQNKAAQIHVVEISNTEIDEEGVGEANKKAFRLAAEKIQNLQHILTDHFPMPGYPFTPITKGDSKSISIAAASIVAKVYRDNLMKTKYHEEYPEFFFDKNVGYGTAEHIEAIKKYGMSSLHRISFKLH